MSEAKGWGNRSVLGSFASSGNTHRRPSPTRRRRVGSEATAGFVLDALEQALACQTPDRWRSRSPQRQPKDEGRFPGGLTRTPIDRPCLAADLPAAQERLLAPEQRATLVCLLAQLVHLHGDVTPAHNVPA